MKYIVVKEIDWELPTTSDGFGGYKVRLKNPILHFFGLDYLFSDKKEAIECAKLRSIGKWDKTKSKKIYESPT